MIVRCCYCTKDLSGEEREKEGKKIRKVCDVCKRERDQKLPL